MYSCISNMHQCDVVVVGKSLSIPVFSVLQRAATAVVCEVLHLASTDDVIVAHRFNRTSVVLVPTPVMRVLMPTTVMSVLVPMPVLRVLVPTSGPLIGMSCLKYDASDASAGTDDSDVGALLVPTHAVSYTHLTLSTNREV